MSLPININDLIHGKSIEWERLEFKKGWNPEEVAHTLCAFANDLNNWGGGYIIIGIDENNGLPILPPAGLQQEQLDKIQGEVLHLANQILPNYYPIMQPYLLQGKQILVLWCPAGDNRPYTALSTQGQKGQRYPYIRFGSRSIIAKGDSLRRLHELAARIPFDDRVNNRSTVDDFDLGLIQAFLQEVKSDLYEESKHISLNDLARQMHIAKGSDEDLRPVNVGLLFFSRQPDLFFPRSWIELVWHKGDADDSFSEVYFKGPIHVQLRAALAFISNNIIAEKVTKINGKAEADRYYNFPYKAVEEALSNAVYHKSYELGTPIEVQIWPDKIEILSFPGPVPPADVQILNQQKRIVARDYRNRRIGDFLKEIHLTEGRGTGFPAIYKAMANNNSPEPVFETNEQCTHFLSTLFANPMFEALQDENEEENIINNDNGSAIDEYGGVLPKIDQKFNSFNDILSYCDQVSDQVIGLNNNNISDFANTTDQVSDQASNQDKSLINSEINDNKNLTNQVSNQVSNQATNQVKAILDSTIHNRVSEILMLTLKPQKRDEILHSMELSNQSVNRKKYLNPLIEYGWIVMLYPDKKSSPKQMYTITEKGKRLLKLITSK